MRRSVRKNILEIIVFVFIISILLAVSACSKTVKYELNFIVDGEVYATISTEGEETISMPADPVKEDYVFDGWYWDDGTWTNPFTADSLLNEKLTSDMSVYAKWIEEDVTQRSYTVTFDSMGGSNVLSVTVKYGNLI